MKSTEVIRIFKEKKALLEGHFVLSSGLHSDRYVQCAKVLQYPAVADDLGKAIAGHFLKNRPDVVVSPAMGGVIIGQSVAGVLNVRAIFTERKDGVMTLRRGFVINPGERILIIEDVITTGKSTGEVVNVVGKYRAKVTAIGCIIDRSAGHTGLPAEVKSLMQLPIKTFPASECPLCKEGTPAVKPGSRT